MTQYFIIVAVAVAAGGITGRTPHVALLASDAAQTGWAVAVRLALVGGHAVAGETPVALLQHRSRGAVDEADQAAVVAGDTDAVRAPRLPLLAVGVGGAGLTATRDTDPAATVCRALPCPARLIATTR